MRMMRQAFSFTGVRNAKIALLNAANADDTRRARRLTYHPVDALRDGRLPSLARLGARLVKLRWLP
jgi:hypothetical protein